MSTCYFENTSRFIPAHWHPGIFIDFVCQQGVDVNRILRGSGIFLEDITRKKTFISVAQFGQIIANAKALLPVNDLSLKYGSRLLPGNFDQLSAALNYSANLAESLQLLTSYPLTVFPLLRARILENEVEAGIEWQDVFGLGVSRRSIVEMACAAVLSFSKWRSGIDLPWRFEFDFEKPSYLEQYEVHLADAINIHARGDGLLFNRAACRMWIPRSYLFHSWRFASNTACNHAKHELVNNRALKIQHGLCGLIADLLETHIAEGLQLQDVAEYLGISVSTLKRKLKSHNSSFQLLLDMARRKKSVDMMLKYNLSQEKIAHLLGIQDSANFRRSFKRWTGLSPSEYLQLC